MNSLTRIFVAEQDCESLVSTMLWLEQYHEFEIYGTDFAGAPLALQIEEIQPDVVILGMGHHSAQAALAAKGIKATCVCPTLILVTKSDATKSDASEWLSAECDGVISSKTMLNDLPEIIKRAIHRHRIAAIAARAVLAKAG